MVHRKGSDNSACHICILRIMLFIIVNSVNRTVGALCMQTKASLALGNICALIFVFCISTKWASGHYCHTAFSDTLSPSAAGHLQYFQRTLDTCSKYSCMHDLLLAIHGQKYAFFTASETLELIEITL